jgi:hypothetical protein
VNLCVVVETFQSAAKIGHFLVSVPGSETSAFDDGGIVFPLGDMIHHQALDPRTGRRQMHPCKKYRAHGRQQIGLGGSFGHLFVG